MMKKLNTFLYYWILYTLSLFFIHLLVAVIVFPFIYFSESLPFGKLLSFELSQLIFSLWGRFFTPFAYVQDVGNSRLFTKFDSEMQVLLAMFAISIPYYFISGFIFLVTKASAEILERRIKKLYFSFKNRHANY